MGILSLLGEGWIGRVSIDNFCSRGFIVYEII